MNDQQSAHARRAASILIHYLGNAAAGSGPDNDEKQADIDHLVDHIVQAAVEEIKRQETADAHH